MGALGLDPKPESYLKKRGAWVSSKTNGGRPGIKVVDDRDPRPDAISLKVVQALCRVGCTLEEIAAELGIHCNTLMNMRQRDPEFKAYMDEAKQRGKASLRRRLWTIALSDHKGAVAASIFLAKNELGMSDKVSNELSGPDGKPIEAKVEIDQTVNVQLVDAFIRQIETVKSSGLAQDAVIECTP